MRALWFGFALGCVMAHPSPARSHSWYEPSCCSSRDCQPVDVRDVGESGDHYTYQGMRFPKTMSRPSQDSRWHVCVLMQGFGQRAIRCIYRPVPGS